MTKLYHYLSFTHKTILAKNSLEITLKVEKKKKRVKSKAISLNGLNSFSIDIYHYLKVNSLSCKEYKLLKTHKKLFLEKINSYLEKIDEIKSNYPSIFKAEVSGKTSIAVSTNVHVNMNETYLVVP